MKYGLIGEKLGHSFSKEIHEGLCGYQYELCPLPPEELAGFLQKRGFAGINVTIPYKQAVMPYLDSIDEKALAIGSVNTIVHRKGKLYGYNTDYDGFRETLIANRIDPKGKAALILGNGGVCRTVRVVLEEMGASRVWVASRRGSPGTVSYEEACQKKEISIVVNATPVGMYPETGKQPVDLSLFPALEAAVDLIYNPLRTRFLQQAAELGAVTANGMLMLVAQAARAASLFCGEDIEPSRVRRFARELEQEKGNIVLTGMPGSGKTTVGRLLADKLQKTFWDLDAAVVEREGMPIPQIFERFGEAGFREREAEAVREASHRNGLVISTGGGAPLFPENIRNLRLNGRIFFLDRPVEKLAISDGRPLSQSRADNEALYQKRIEIYRSTCDRIVANGGEAAGAVDAIEKDYWGEPTV